MSDRNPGCEWVLENLDAFVDHELGEAGHAAVTAHCASCGDCTRELEMAIRVRRMLHAMPAFEAPAHVVDAAEREALAAAANVVPLRARRVRARRIAVAAAAAAVVIASTLWFGERRRAAHELQLSDADVRRATAELELAFAYVDRYSDGVVREDVLGKRVMPTIERAIGTRDGRTPGTKPAGRDSGL